MIRIKALRKFFTSRQGVVEALRGIDALVIDDLQFLQGKTVQQEFCHTLNALIDAGRQVVVAADRAPGASRARNRRKLSSPRWFVIDSET